MVVENARVADSELPPEFLVNGIDGETCRFPPFERHWTDQGNESFSPILQESDAIRITETELARLATRTRLGNRSASRLEVRCLGVIEYPYWILYYHRGKNVDFRMLDAVGGTHCGSRTKIAFLTALSNKKSEKMDRKNEQVFVP